MTLPSSRAARRVLLVAAAALGAACAARQPGAAARAGAAVPAQVSVNQVGYLPGFPKLATVRTTEAAALEWKLVDAAGQAVATGKAQPLGLDAASGDAVQLVDFSAVNAPGKGYMLAVGGGKSTPFAIGADLYAKLKYDALALFYHQRSGTPIVMPYAGDKGWVRAAGHLGDKKVPCAHEAGCKYWAAAELFITTGGAEYQEFLAASPLFKKVPTDVEAGHPTSMTWAEVASCGSISLAVVPSKLSAADRDAIRAEVKAAADRYVSAESAEGYRTPFSAKSYPWGSNSFVLNNLLVIALAGDFTGEPRYTDAVAVGMDYLLGRNPLDQSYLTGYGSNPLLHPHHRFFAFQINPAFPPPPPGIVSGGPNSGLQDPRVKQLGLPGCAPERCWVDEIEAWSVNELAINWNAPLAWVAAYLDETAKRPAAK
jgi:hypothetical protein